MTTTQQLAKHIYHTYCTAVGGVAFNNEPLPDWDTFAADPAKQKQARAWEAIAAEALKGACRQRTEPGVAMDFGTALNCIRDGEAVTRMGHVYTRDNLHQITPTDMLAEDWEVVFPLV